MRIQCRQDSKTASRGAVPHPCVHSVSRGCNGIVYVSAKTCGHHRGKQPSAQCTGTVACLLEKHCTKLQCLLHLPAVQCHVSQTVYLMIRMTLLPATLGTWKLEIKPYALQIQHYYANSPTFPSGLYERTTAKYDMEYLHTTLVSPQPHDIVLQRDKIVVRTDLKTACFASACVYTSCGCIGPQLQHHCCPCTALDVTACIFGQSSILRMFFCTYRSSCALHIPPVISCAECVNLSNVTGEQ